MNKKSIFKDGANKNLTHPNNSKGITLIALVITIIVLLILAGVAISMLSGENGILKQAAKAKTETDKQSTKEAIKVGVISALTQGTGEIKTALSLEKALKEQGLKITGNVVENKKVYTATINDKYYVITADGEINPLETDVTKLTTEVEEKTIYEDVESNNQRAVIPKGFKVSSVTKTNEQSGEQNIDTGLVVIAPDGSEFVWVPVPDAIYDGTTKINVGTYTPMARMQSGTKNYQGILYDLNQKSGSQVVYDLTKYSVGTTKNREPSLITGNNMDTYAIMENVTGTSYDNGSKSSTSKKSYELAGYSSIKEFGKDMQDEYNNMVISVNKYKGFYVGRYETGIENGKAVSKNAYTTTGVTTADGYQSATKYWYGLYNKQRTMATDSKYTGVESSMIWGSQYDAMMNWMINTGNVVGTVYDNTKWTSGINVTGQSENDIINKVHDLYGCHYEWILEATSTKYRVLRGGDDVDSYSPSHRRNYAPYNANKNFGSRLTLYVK